MAASKHSRIGQAVAAALAFIFGARRNGFIDTTQASPQAQERPKDAPILESERDGRRYAIAMLAAVDEEGGEALGVDADYEASSEEPGLFYICRTGPQSMVLREHIENLYKYGSQAAIGGFYVVLTELFADRAGGGHRQTAEYAEVERAGKFPPAGSVIYTHPEAAAAAIARGEDSYCVPRSEPKADKPEAEKKAKREPSREQKAAEEVSGATSMGFHALIDIARNCGKENALNAFTVRDAAGAMVDRISVDIGEFSGCIGKAYPKAKKEIKKSLAALDGMQSFLNELDCSYNDEGTFRWHGRVIHAYTLDAARALARAQEAAGGHDDIGWLDESAEWDAE